MRPIQNDILFLFVLNRDMFKKLIATEAKKVQKNDIKTKFCKPVRFKMFVGINIPHNPIGKTAIPNMSMRIFFC